MVGDIILSCVSAVILGLLFPVAKNALKKVDSFAFTTVLCGALFVIHFVLSIVSGAVSLIAGIGNNTLLRLLPCGVLAAAFMLLSANALNTGKDSLVFPILNTCYVFQVIWNCAFDGEGFSAACLIGIFLFTGGTVLSLASAFREKRKSSNGWQPCVFACLAAVIYGTRLIYMNLFLPESHLNRQLTELFSFFVAGITLLLLCVVFGKFKGRKKLFKSGYFPCFCIANVLAAAFFVFRILVSGSSNVSSLLCICYPVAYIGSCYMQKEKYSLRQAAYVGVTTLGMFLMIYK